MKKDILVLINTETSKIINTSSFILGVKSENLQGKIIFKPEPFIEGTCRMYIEGRGSILMPKEEDCYTLDILSSLLTEPSLDICFKITEPENEKGVPIFCSKIIHFKVYDTIESSGDIPEDYPSWEQILDSKIAELEALEEDVEQAEQERDRKVDEAVENIEDMTEAYNQNAVEKTNEFNTNATNKTTAFDNHVSSKETEFDTDTDTIVSTKKAELDDYEVAKENELDTHANSLKKDLDDYESAKETELNSYTSTKKTELDTYTNTKKSELDTHESNLECDLDDEAVALTSAFNTNATTKTNEFNTNATNKTTEFNTNATAKTTDFNNNATQKTTDFNDNAAEKTTEYDTNATEKVDEYNANAEDKIAEYDAHVAELQTEIDELKETVDSELETAVVEGTSIDVSDSAKADGSIGVRGNTEQKQLSGKNFFSGDVLISINSSDTKRFGFEFKKSGTYTLSFKSSSTFKFGHKVKENGVYSSVVEVGSPYTFTLEENQTAIFYNGTENTTFSAQGLYEVQLEEGSTATEYEEYCGGQASPNPDYPQEIKKVAGYNKIKCTRKNLLPSTVFEFCTITSSGEKIIGNSRICSDFIKVKKLQNYTLRSINQFGFIGVAFYDSNKKYIDRTIGNNIKSIKVIIPAQCSYVKIFAEYGSGTEQSNMAFKEHKMQLELGTATDYEEYEGKEFELNLGNIELYKIGDYEDVLFKNEVGSKYYNESLVENAWYIHEKIGKKILNGNESWNKSGEDTNYFIGKITLSHEIGLNYNSHFPVNTSGYTEKLDTGNSSTTLYIGIDKSRLATPDAAGLKQWLSNNNVDLMYLLVTPTYTQITDETLITQLEALHKFRTEQGVIHIWTDAEELEPNLEFTYKRSNNLRLQALEQAVVALGGV